MVKAEDSCPRGCGFDSRLCRKDHFSFGSKHELKICWKLYLGTVACAVILQIAERLLRWLAYKIQLNFLE